MAIDTPHPDYEAAAEKWARCRAVLEGEDAVKAGGETYLPKPAGQTDDEYQNYVVRALFFEATGRTHDGLLGMVMRKDPAVEVPESVAPLLDDVTLSDVPFASFASQVTSEVLGVGRAGILVDMQDERSEAAEKRRPYCVLYNAEQITNWRTTRIGGDQVLTLVVLQESSEDPDPEDPDGIASVTTDRFRVLTLDAVDESSTPSYRVRVYERKETVDPVTKKSTSVFVLKEDLQPRILGQPMRFIPFAFVGPESISPEVQRPPLLSVVNVNLSHYRNSADLEWARYWVAHPQIYISGTESAGPWTIGGANVWTFQDPSAKADKVAITAEDLSGLSQGLKDKEAMMAALGARLLEEQKREAESAEALRIRGSGEDSALQRIVSSVSQGLTKALRWLAEFASADSSAVKVQLNKEFIAATLSANDLKELVAAWQGNAISWETLYANLVRGAVARPGVPAEEERSAIDAEGSTEEM